MNLVTTLAMVRVPSGLSPFRVARVDSGDREVSYRVACPCGAETGTIISEYVADGQFWADPLAYGCIACDFSAVLFDSRKDGYDAVLNNFSANLLRTKDEPVKCATCGSEAHKVLASYRYDLEDEEVEEGWDTEQRQQMPDVFTSAAFELSCGQCGETQWLADFECA